MIEIQAKSRYGANPVHQNTFTITQPPENAATFLSEKDRFNIRGRNEVEVVHREKEKKKLNDLHRIEKLKLVNNRIQENTQIKEFINEQKNTFSQLQRTIKLYKYENVKNMKFIFFLKNLIF